MSGVQQRLNLKRTPIDTWSLKEQLTLASAVLKSEDQNWVTVSRMMKQFAEPGRPHDWINQKTCAAQYNLLEERFNIRRPKRGEKLGAGESPMELIVNKLSQERISELEKIVAIEKEEIQKLESEAELLSSDDITEEQLNQILEEIKEEEAVEDKKEAEHNEWLAKREAKIQEIKKILTTNPGSNRNKHDRSQSDLSGSELDSAADSPMVEAVDAESPSVTETMEQDSAETADVSTSQQTPVSSISISTSAGVSSSPSSSPLLTSLLQSPSKTSSFPTSPISHLAPNFHKTPTSGTNLLHKFSSQASVTPPQAETPKIADVKISEKVKDTDDKDDVLDDINELLKDKLREGEISKEDNIVDTDSDVKTELIKEEVDVKESDDNVFKEEVKVDLNKKIVDKTILAKPETTATDKTPDNISPKSNVKSGDDASDSKAAVQGLDGVESVPCSPLTTPVGSRSMTPTPTTTPPSSSSKMVSTEEDRDYRAWKKSIILVWSQISQHKNANLFANAVTEADAPDYRDIVFRPMDLNSIKKNLESGHIKTTEEFERDLMLMFFNATMYNSSDHEVYKLTVDMHRDTQKILVDYKSAQLLQKESEPKSLRGKSESAETNVSRPRGRSVSGSVGDNTPISSRSETRKRERSGSMMIEETSRTEKKRKV